MGTHLSVKNVSSRRYIISFYIFFLFFGLVIWVFFALCCFSLSLSLNICTLLPLFSPDYLVNCIEYMTNKMTNILDNLDLRVIYQLNFISHEISKWHNVVASCELLTELPCKYKILCSMLLCRLQQMLSKVFFFYFLFVFVCVCFFFGGGGGWGEGGFMYYFNMNWF